MYVRRYQWGDDWMLPNKELQRYVCGDCDMISTYKIFLFYEICIHSDFLIICKLVHKIYHAEC